MLLQKKWTKYDSILPIYLVDDDWVINRDSVATGGMVLSGRQATEERGCSTHWSQQTWNNCVFQEISICTDFMLKKLFVYIVGTVVDVHQTVELRTNKWALCSIVDSTSYLFSLSLYCIPQPLHLSPFFSFQNGRQQLSTMEKILVLFLIIYIKIGKFTPFLTKHLMLNYGYCNSIYINFARLQHGVWCPPITNNYILRAK